MHLGEYPHGLFVYENTLCFKDEYNDSYIISSGEAFWGGTKTKDERDNLIKYGKRFNNFNCNR